jgi:predicted transglutaminase-like protease
MKIWSAAFEQFHAYRWTDECDFNRHSGRMQMCLKIKIVIICIVLKIICLDLLQVWMRKEFCYTQISWQIDMMCVLSIVKIKYFFHLTFKLQWIPEISSTWWGRLVVLVTTESMNFKSTQNSNVFKSMNMYWHEPLSLCSYHFWEPKIRKKLFTIKNKK